MEDKFDSQNTHSHNVKIAIDKILGQKTEIRRRKKTYDDHRRELFCKILNNLVEVQERTIILDEMYSINMEKYESGFYVIIDDMMEMMFNKEQLNLINFYLYDRFSSDGSIVDLVDVSGEIVKLDTPDDLWFLLKNIDNA